MAYVRCSNGGGTTSLKDFYRDKVLNGGLTSICTLATGTRANFNEGDVVVDTTKRTCYLYADFTILADRPSPSDYSSLLAVSGMSNTYLPRYTTNSRSNMVGLCCDDTSTRPCSTSFGYGASSYRFIAGYGESLYKDDHIIVYGSWTY